MKTRVHVESKQLTPKGVMAWDTLMSQAITKAEATGDRRLAGLRRAIQEGKSEQVLRSFGIISEADLQREFQGIAK
jgi:hypothetical protein